MCMTSDEAVKITAFLRLGCAPHQIIERQVPLQGSASVFYVLCSSGQIWPTVHVVSLSLSSRKYYFCFIVLFFFF